MRDQTARDPKFPVACARCGGRISEPIAFCPHCGAHARFALAGTAAPADPTQHAGSGRREPHAQRTAAHARSAVPPDDFEGDLDPPWPGRPTPLFASPDGDPYGNVRAPAFRGARPWGFKGGTALVVAGFIVLYGGAVAIHRYDGVAPLPQPSASKSVEGVIAPNGGADASLPPPVSSKAPQQSAATNATNATHANDTALAAPPMGTGKGDGASSSPNVTQNATAPSPAAPPVSQAAAIAPVPAPATSVVQAPPSAVQAPVSTDVRPPSDTRSAQSRVRSSGTTVANVPARESSRSQPQRDTAGTGRASAAHALDIAQAQLSKSDLRGARASLARVLSADPRNAQALALREDLLAREQARDASLGEAHGCVVQSRWNCVWHNAGKALSIDASSTEAKALVDRAIVESGAAVAPAGPGPDNVQVPMVQ